MLRHLAFAARGNSDFAISQIILDFLLFLPIPSITFTVSNQV